MSDLSLKLNNLPDLPGCYIMKDLTGLIIYIGKAKNLKKRVKQYFYSNIKSEKVMQMVANIHDFEYVITASETDALTLEANLVGKHKPKYNILLKDDKAFPYLKVNLKEDYPCFVITRRLKKDGSKYFGPFLNGVGVRDVLEILNLAFSVRPCNQAIKIKPKRECLNYHIKKCLAPCAGKTTPKEYKQHVEEAMDFLNGNDEKVEELLKGKMLFFAEREQFENAIFYKEKLEKLKRITDRKITALNKFVNADVIAYFSDGINSCINTLITRGGRMQGSVNYEIKDLTDDEPEALESFMLQYYSSDKELPDEIYVSSGEEYKALEDYFKEKFGKTVRISMPKQGVKRRLIEMSYENAAEYIDKFVERIKLKEEMTLKACEHLKEALGLKSYPKRMECYDISNISGTDKVGSMVVFIDGKAERKLYRRFKIRTVEGANDFESLKEVLSRRLKRLDEAGFATPDLIIIDGGKGQLSSVTEAFDEAGVNIELISLAKREEEVFTIYSKEPVILEKRDNALKLLQRIRDESHRFAVTYHRALRDKRGLESALDGIEGVGKEKRNALLKYFKSIDRIKDAGIDELKEVPGIGGKLAEIIYSHFKEKR